MSLVVLLDAGVLGALLRVVQRIFGSRKRIALEGGAGSHNVGPIPEDADCAAEVEAMLHRNSTSPALAIQGARKTFGRGSSQVAAVENLWLQIESGQCFGLLGTNGAGKTTTFKLLVGEEAPDSGDILIDGRSIVKESRACGILSYCPQQSALPSLLSGKEVLTVYAHVRGIPSANITPLVSSLLDQLGLWEIADQACGTYSGGNRRKLSVAVSILAAPRITLMDEPSTGMDPGKICVGLPWFQMSWHSLISLFEISLTQHLAVHSGGCFGAGYWTTTPLSCHRTVWRSARRSAGASAS